MMPISPTEKLGLTKIPDTEPASVEIFNGNWDILDDTVGSMKHVDKIIPTLVLATGVVGTADKNVNWFVRQYEDGRMEIESDPVEFIVPIDQSWYSMKRSNSSFTWAFPVPFVSHNMYEIKTVSSDQLCFEVPVLSVSSQWESQLTMSSWKTWMFWAAPDTVAKNAVIRLRCRVTGKWK